MFFFFGFLISPFIFFLFVFAFFDGFNGPIGPGTPEAKTLLIYVKKSFFILKIYYGDFIFWRFLFFNFKT